jgi:hypothetical protein
MTLFGKKPVVFAQMCSACSESLAEHEQLDIASAEVGTEDDKRLTAFVRAHEWRDARQYQSANAVTDIRVWRMIRCRNGRASVVALVMPIETWSDNYYEEQQFLSDTERDQLVVALT